MLPEQCRAARALLGWNQVELGRLAGVSQNKVARFELRYGLNERLEKRTMASLRAVLVKAGAEFINTKTRVGVAIRPNGRTIQP